VAPYLKKGTQVYVEGTPDVRSYTTTDGRQGASLTLRIVSVQLLGAKPSGSGGEQPNYGGESNPAQSYNPAPTAAADSNEAMDDLPF
jgi:single-strand DNA-binding protein